MHITLSTRRAKNQARHLQTQMKADGCPLAYSRCLEIVAGLHGYDSYNALEAVLPAEPPAAPVALADAGIEAIEAELARRGRLVLLATDADVLAEDHDVPVSAVLANADRLKTAVENSSVPDALSEIGFAVLGDIAPSADDDPEDEGDADAGPEDHPDPRMAVPDAIAEIDAGQAPDVRTAVRSALHKLGDYAFGRPGRYGIAVAVRGRPAVWARGYVMREGDGTPACIVAVPDMRQDVLVVAGAVVFELPGLADGSGAFDWARLEAQIFARAKQAGLTLTSS